METPFGSFQRGVLRQSRKNSMINERLKKRLRKDRPSTTITMRIPADVVSRLRLLLRHAAYRLSNYLEELH